MNDFFTVARPPLARSWDSRHIDGYDVVVIGSGYGGSICAARIATASWPSGQSPSVCLLERGKEWLPGHFPDRLSEAVDALYDQKRNPLGLYKFDAGEDIVSFQGSGLGGTSLLNANVAYEPEKEVFDDPHWPQEIRAARDTNELAGLYERVRFTLQTGKHPRGSELSKVKALKKGAEGHTDAPHRLNDIAVNFEPDGENRWRVPQRKCLNCGDCVTGCNPGAKNTLDTNYLAIAKHGGAHIFTGIDVQHLEKQANGEWLIHCTRHLSSETSEEVLICARKAVVVSAGSLGSTEILMRSQAQGLDLSTKLGQRFSGNADFFGMAYNTDHRTDVLGWGAFPLSDRARRIQSTPKPAPDQMLFPGPTIVSTVRYNSTDSFHKRVTVQDTSIPLTFVDIIRAGLAVSIGIDTDPHDVADNLSELGRRLVDFGAIDKELEKGALNHTLMYLVMGVDDAAGVISLDSSGSAKIEWDKVGEQEVFKLQNDLLKSNAANLGATFLKHPLWGFSPWRTLVTVHPLGGCAMGADADGGVVNHQGQVFAGSGGFHNGLYVTDGSIVPAPIGANPFLAISALSERVAKGVISHLSGTPQVMDHVP